MLQDQAHLQETLVTVFDAAVQVYSAVEYRLVGTSAALLQGVNLPVGDVDFLVKTRSGVDAFSQALSSFDCLEAPEYLSHDRQY